MDLDALMDMFVNLAIADTRLLFKVFES